jgi:betaine-aldehyde dehydrogenase
MYIDGRWTGKEGRTLREIINPADGKVIAEVAEGTAEDVDAAVKAARRAFSEGKWSNAEPEYRAEKLKKAADMIEKNKDELAVLETRNNGKILKESIFDMEEAAAYLRYFADMSLKVKSKEIEVPADMKTSVIYQPVGVCGLIVPWNYPLLMAMWKLAPALAAGNTIILKPASVTPLTTIRFFEFLDRIGFPPGTVNLITGPGPVVGSAMASHPDIDLIAFTGGTDTGREIIKNSAVNIKKTTLELGGKSPNIIFADADLDAALDYALDAIFMTQGEVCSAGSRLLIQEGIHDSFLTRLVDRAEKIRTGNGLDESSRIGALVSESHMNKVLNYIKSGIDEGARLLCGGKRLTGPGLSEGYFVPPTIFTGVKPDMKIAREEIFGPVLTVFSFRDEEEALRMANDTVYGLAAGVFTSDPQKADRVVKGLQAGTVWVNCFNDTFKEAPWGGLKHSGIGRELGQEGFEEYLEIKQVNVNMDVKPTGWFS